MRRDASSGTSQVPPLSSLSLSLSFFAHMLTVAFSPGERWVWTLFFFLQALLDLSINRQWLRLPWDNQAQARCRSVAEACRATEKTGLACHKQRPGDFNGSNHGFYSAAQGSCSLTQSLAAKEQDKKDIAISTMASLPFGQVPAVYYSNGSIAVISRMTRSR